MKKLATGLLLALTVLLGACGGLKGELDGNTFDFIVKAEGQQQTLGQVTFEGDKVTLSKDGQEEKMDYSLKDDDLIFSGSDGNDNFKIFLKKFKRVSDTQFEGNLEIIQNGQKVDTYNGKPKGILEKQ